MEQYQGAERVEVPVGIDHRGEKVGAQRNSVYHHGCAYLKHQQASKTEKHGTQTLVGMLVVDDGKSGQQQGQPSECGGGVVAGECIFSHHGKDRCPVRCVDNACAVNVGRYCRKLLVKPQFSVAGVLQCGI